MREYNVLLTQDFYVVADNEEDAIDASLAILDGDTQPKSGARVMYYKFYNATATLTNKEDNN